MIVFASFAFAVTASSGLGITGCGSSDLRPIGDGGPNATTDDGGNPDATQDSSSDQGAGSSDTGLAADGGPSAPVLPACGMPTLVPNGGSVVAGSTVSILPSAGFPMSGVIFYTTDGTLPTHASPMYSGPIQLNVAETIKAMAFAQGTCTDSLVATAAFTVTMPEAGMGTGPVTFAPPSATQFNDFTVSLSAGAGTTICYTLDGTTVPACTAAGGCMTGSTPYNPTSQIGITGAITNATTGLVAVKAIACAAGVPASPAVGQTYGLKAAAPAFQSPSAPSVVPYPGASPTVSTATTATGTSVPSLHYTTDGTTPTCTTGTEVNGTAGGASGSVPLTTTTSFKVVACKTGYATSDVTTGAYSVQLNAPVFANGTGTYYDDVSPGLSVGPTGQNPGGAWVCYSTSGAARCAPLPRACGAGSAAESVAASTIVKTGTVLNAVTCTPDATKYAQSAEMAAQTYTLQLGPIAFSPNGGSVGNAGTLGTIKISNSKGDDSTNPSAKDYAFICWTNDDGAPEPDCVCAHATPAASLTGVHKSPPTTRSELDNAVATAPNNLRIRAVGCDGATPPNSNYLPSNTPAARVHFNSTAQLQSPDIAPVPGTYDNDQDIVLSNSSAVAAVLCYSTNGIDPSTSATSCTAGGANGGATTCLPAVSAAGGGSASATISGLLDTTGLDVRALACDPTRVLANSPVAANTYTLQVAKPTVSPANGTVNVGQTVVFATATASTSASPVTFYYTIDGSAPACGTGPLHIPGNTATPSTASYAITGLEVSGIRVLGCRANYVQSNVSNTTAYAIAAERPVLSYASGTFDDYLSPAIQATSSNNGTYWICFTTDGSSPACGTTNDHCTAAGGTAIARAQLSAANCTGLPNGSSALSGRCGVPPAIDVSNTTLQAVSCTKPGATVFESPVVAATYVLNVSDVKFSPAGGTETAPIPTVAAALVPTTTAPAGNPPAPGTDGVTGGATICVAHGASQPAMSACVSDLNWKCGAGPQQTAASNVATTTTFYAFACKTGMASTPVRKVDYTFSATPYVHTGLAMTGHATDFTAGAELINNTMAYVTWDSTFLYVGFDVQANLTGGSGSAWIHYYVAGASGGTATADSTALMRTPDTALPPAHSQFHVFLALVGTGIVQAQSGVSSWDGSAWVAEAVTLTAVHTAGTFYEIKIPLVAGHLDLTTMGEFHLAGEGYDTTKKAFGAWPMSNAAGNLST